MIFSYVFYWKKKGGTLIPISMKVIHKDSIALANAGFVTWTDADQDTWCHISSLGPPIEVSDTRYNVFLHTICINN